MTKDVVVVIGVGGMGLALARRQGPGRSLLLADFDERTLAQATKAAADEGLTVTAQPVDVSSRRSVDELAAGAAALGPLSQVVHTAGLSPVQASADAILAVDLLGVAQVLESFGAVVADGGAGVVIASMAAYLAPPLDADVEQQLRQTPCNELLELAAVRRAADAGPGMAYAFAKRANQLRVAAAAPVWGDRGARVNSISPGVIATSMGHQELDSEAGPFMRAMVDASSAGRLGIPDDIAAAAAFLLGPDSAFVTGVDLLVDGGVVAAVRSGRLS